MGDVSEELRERLEKMGSVPSLGYEMEGHRIMEGEVTTVQVGDGTEGILTFEETDWGTLSCEDLTPEMAAWLVNAPHARQLLVDALAVVTGWGWKLNELCGYAPDDVSQYPAATAARLIERAHDLGMEV